MSSIFNSASEGCKVWYKNHFTEDKCMTAAEIATMIIGVALITVGALMLARIIVGRPGSLMADPFTLKVAGACCVVVGFLHISYIIARMYIPACRGTCN